MAKIIQFPGAFEEDDRNTRHEQVDHSGDSGNQAIENQPPLADVKILGPMGRSGPEYVALSALYGQDLEAAASTLEITPRMTPEDLEAVPVLTRVCRLLELVSDAGCVKMTPAGFLPLSLVGRLADEVYNDLPQRPRVGGSREMDIRQLYYERKLAMRAGLLVLSNGYLKLTDRSEQLLLQMRKPSPGPISQESHTRALNTLFESLLHARLENSDALEECSLVKHSEMISKAVLLFLFALAGKQGELIFQEDLIDLLARLLPREFRASVAQSALEPFEMLDWDISYRFFNMFAVPFGFCTDRPGGGRDSFLLSALAGEEHASLKRRDGPWLVTDLFSRVFQFHQELPQECFLNDPQAALLLTDLAAGSTHEYFAKRFCLLAIERDPTCAEAYVLLASIERQNPEQALRVLETGIAMGEERKPALPVGVSAWRDHMYRDVLRLRFARAESLVTVGRHEEALAAYQEILRLEPEDNIGARYKLVPLLIAAARLDEAAQLVDAFADGADEAESAFVRWNRTLIAYAWGGAKQAGPLLEAAMEANEYVVEELLYIEPFPEIMPDSYYIGSPEEAMVYAEESIAAWRKVKGARAWLRRKVEG
jgi:tetratricopeptide (TPR) repeat protein